MKKLFTILTFAASIAMFACSDNSDEVFQEAKQVKINVQKTVGGSPIDFEKTF